MPVEIVLSEEEQSLAFTLAAKRYISNRKSGVTNSKKGNQPDTFTDLNGIGGEIAVARYFGVYPDLSVFPRSCGYDLKIKGKDGKSHRVDVKTTHYNDGNLLHTTKETHDVDRFILVTGTFPSYRIIGWCAYRDLCQEASLTDLGHGPTYLLKQDRLTSIS